MTLVLKPILGVLTRSQREREREKKNRGGAGRVKGDEGSQLHGHSVSYILLSKIQSVNNQIRG